MLNVIVTGASRGLGLGIAERLVAASYRVIAIARGQSEQLAAVMEGLEDRYRDLLQFRPFDLGNLSEIPDFVRQLRNEFGAIYGLVNNAVLGRAAS